MHALRRYLGRCEYIRALSGKETYVLSLNGGHSTLPPTWLVFPDEPVIKPLSDRHHRKATRVMIAMQKLLQWFTHNPLGAATVIYITSVFGVLVYAYFEPTDQR